MVVRPFNPMTLMRNRLLVSSLALLSSVACTNTQERQRADSSLALVTQQRALLGKLSAERDSVSQTLADANLFIGRIDSSISRVKGLGPSSRKKASESGIEDQLRARKDMLRRVDALVERARSTARQVTDLKKQHEQLLATNGKLTDENRALKDSIAADVRHIAELMTSVDQQAQTIVLLQGRIDELGKELETVRSESAKAYYVVGTEDELLQKGVITREGGTNLLVHRFGRTLVPARDLTPAEFTAIDTRAVHTIALPDSTREYQIVSRQSLDDAKVTTRDGAKFHGPLQIAEADKFWATSKYLIIVQR
jgi:regulator of replication initiation timing